MSIEDELRESREVSFQAALLYTSSKGERRIRYNLKEKTKTIYT